MSKRARRETDPSTVVAEQLLSSYETPHLREMAGVVLPSPTEAAALLEDLRDLLFPGLTGRPMAKTPVVIRKKLDATRRRLARQIALGLTTRARVQSGGMSMRKDAERIASTFLTQLPALREKLALDVRAAYQGDPAAVGTEEVVFCYPGIYAITAYRIAHVLLALGARILPRMLTEIAHARTGIDIHPGAVVGDSFFIDHGTGVVIGETTEIGARVRIYQGVTLGALSVAASENLRGKKRHPTVGDDVIIYANATILGGETVIGGGAVIGGNTWVTASVPPGGRVVAFR